MPLAQITLLAGATDDQKRRTIAGVTEALVDALGVAPSAVRVLVSELPPVAWGVGGKPVGAG